MLEAKGWVQLFFTQHGLMVAASFPISYLWVNLTTKHDKIFCLICAWLLGHEPCADIAPLLLSPDDADPAEMVLPQFGAK
ncbi:hypothetical protein [Nostoc sp. TCL26-01]|uniref:hypothetical protein n=1 Tax=Nostoc sp. TCL26-01 TaxID=2576904 RepID=UPI0015BF661E|nr:hypothetical protein [Nostoc sp. TCL26-01]QLE56860.1 hypothetical protein FD725_15875 [Nostoc sp. TCL26-01]